jgi:hypothetical protein
MKCPTGKCVVCLFLVVSFTLASATAHSAVLTVTNTQDSGPGSLRDRIATAATTGDTIQFDAALNGQTITLTSAQLLINKSLTINGPGADKLAVQRSSAAGTPAFRIFEIPGSSIVTLAGLTISNGNESAGGGGISMTHGRVMIVDCVISGNSAPGGSGGGISSSLGSSLTITRSTISGNSASYGGGLSVPGSPSTILGPAQLGMTNSTISGNVATEGGGLRNSGMASIVNCTFSANSASIGGGIWNRKIGFLDGVLNITNSTVTGNSALEGGGICTLDFGTSGSRNTIFASNTAANGPDVKGKLSSNGFNLVGNNAGATILSPQVSDQIGTAAAPIDPLLGPLQNNGGPTFTHALRLGSPAIDKGESSGSTIDQRGFGRRKDVPALANAPGGDGADIGAYETAFATLANISIRLRVQTADNAMIGGFIITGTAPKTVIVRGIGPSLALAGALTDPFIDVYGPSGEFLATNDNWRDAASSQQIIASGLAPTNDLEPALWGILNPGAYTVVVRGKNNATGIGLFEVYDLDQTVDSRLGNISTRGFVGTGDDVMIGGTIIAGAVPARVIFRAIGPSLTNFGLPNALENPHLELYDANGGLVAANYDWRDTQEAEIIATGLAPSNNLESAMVRDLLPGPYTAIVRGPNNTTGVALVEVYNLN